MANFLNGKSSTKFWVRFQSKSLDKARTPVLPPVAGSKMTVVPEHKQRHKGAARIKAFLTCSVAVNSDIC